ncbi:MAG: serine hydrolase domain-containing protein [Planctomycetota bacterium]
MRARSAWIAIAASLVRLAAQAPPEDPDAAWQSAVTTALQRAVDAAVDPRFFGCVLVVRDGRELLREARGIAFEDGRACTIDALFDVASVSKQFTAAAILRLRDQGRLTLRDPLHRFFRDAPKDKRDIRIEQVMAHEAGFPLNLEIDESAADDLDAWLERLWSTPLVGEPGARFVYSNAGYGLLAAIVTEVAHRPFESFVQDELLRSSGMRDTRFTGCPDDAPPDPRDTMRIGSFADRRFHDTALRWPRHWQFRGATGIVSTVDDLWRWDRALSGDRILEVDSRDLMLKPAPRDYGGGLQSETTAWGTSRQSHSGSVHGYRSWFVRYPDDGAFAVVLGNEHFVVATVATGIEQALFGAGVPPSSNLAMAGRYRSEVGDEIELIAEGSTLRARFSGAGLGAFTRRDGETAAARSARRAIEDLVRKRGHATRVTDKETATRAASVLDELQRAGGSLRDASFLCFGATTSEAWFRIVARDGPHTLRARLDERQRIASLDTTTDEPPLPATALVWRQGRHFVARVQGGREDLVLVGAQDGKSLALTAQGQTTTLALVH